MARTPHGLLARTRGSPNEIIVTGFVKLGAKKRPRADDADDDIDSLNLPTPDSADDATPPRDETANNDKDADGDDASEHSVAPDPTADAMDIDERGDDDEPAPPPPAPARRPAKKARRAAPAAPAVVVAAAAAPDDEEADDRAEPERRSLRHTKNPFAANRAARHTRSLFTPEDAARVNSRYVDRMKPLRVTPVRELGRRKKRKDADAARKTTRDNLRPVVIRTAHRQLAVAHEELEEGCVSKNDERLLASLRDLGRIVPKTLWERYVLANARRFRSCHSAFLSLDIALLAFMINTFYDATEFHNGERHRIDAAQLKYIMQHVWPLRNRAHVTYPQ